MRQKFEFDGDGVDLILSHPNGDLLRCPLASLLSMATLNDGEFARFTHEVPPADPFNPDARPTRRHVRIMVEETPVPEQVDTLALVEVEPGAVRIVTDPAAVTGPTARLITDREDGVVSGRMFPPSPAPLLPYTPAVQGVPVREDYEEDGR